VTYAELLEVFWAAHNPTSRSWSRQYKTAVFYHNEEQKRLAAATRERVAAQVRSHVYTEVLPASTFTLAEGYHQKYYLRQHRELLRAFTTKFPEAEELVASTAVARVNGYLAGHGSAEQLAREIDGLGISPSGRLALQKSVGQRGRY